MYIIDNSSKKLVRKGINDWRFNLPIQFYGHILPKGSYTLVIDPIWNESAYHDKAHQKINVATYAPKGIVSRLEPLPEQEPGFVLLAEAFKHHARTAQNTIKWKETGSDQYPAYAGVKRAF